MVIPVGWHLFVFVRWKGVKITIGLNCIYKGKVAGISFAQHFMFMKCVFTMLFVFTFGTNLSTDFRWQIWNWILVAVDISFVAKLIDVED